MVSFPSLADSRILIASLLVVQACDGSDPHPEVEFPNGQGGLGGSAGSAAAATSTGGIAGGGWAAAGIAGSTGAFGGAPPEPAFREMDREREPGTRDADQYVVVVSLDGLAPRFLEELLEDQELPTFAALQKRAAWTHNARTTPGSTLTFPNHFSMLTSRPAKDGEQFSPGRAHGLLYNAVLPDDETVHSQGVDPYVPSVFDVVHDNGGRTGLFAGKEKFQAFSDGYGPELGAEDPYPKDYGKNKVDVVSVVDGHKATEVVASFIAAAKTAPLNFSLVHLRDTDTAGHSKGWGSPAYMDALRAMDQSLGELFGFLDSTSPYKDKVHVFVTTDHGGVKSHHAAVNDPLNFRIPLYLVSPTVQQAGDLYALAGAFRAPPPTDQYAVEDTAPPIRNTDVGNLGATLLGLPEIPNSTVHSFHLHGQWFGGSSCSATVPSAKPDPTRIEQGVILVNLGGLAPHFIDRLIAEGKLPTFTSLQRRAAWTHDARTTPRNALAFPNQFSMLTSRPATDQDRFSPGRAHGLLIDAPPEGTTIHGQGLDAYVPSVFDVVHDNGGRTGLFANQEGLRSFAEGYGPIQGARDPYPKDFGKNKIDAISVAPGPASNVIASFITEAKVSPFNFAFLHLGDADSLERAADWGSPAYLDAVIALDQSLGMLLSFLDSTPALKHKTHVLITADRGGAGSKPESHTDPFNFTVPIYLIGPAVKQATDLYQLAGYFRKKPPADQYAVPKSAPPIRTTDLGNLSATLLGLPEIPNSTVHSFHFQGCWPFQGLELESLGSPGSESR